MRRTSPYAFATAWLCIAACTSAGSCGKAPKKDLAAEREALKDAACAKDIRLAYGPLLGAVSDTSIKIWGRSNRPGVFAIDCRPVGETAFTPCGPDVILPTKRDNTGTVTLTGLTPRTRYEYRVRAWDEHSPAACVSNADAEGTFRTLPAQGQPGRVRFVTGADVTGGNVRGFDAIGAQKPNFVLMIGDNVYADGFGESWKMYRRRYLEVWGGKQFRALFAKVPVFMTWDDHEIMENYWKGKDDRIYAFSRRLFDDYQGQHNPAPLTPGELYYSFHAADVGFFVLDTRTHRSPNEDPDSATKSMLGAVQKQALEDFLTQDKSRVHVIVSSVLMAQFSSTGKDSWRSFKSERTAILDTIARAGTANTFVVSGDQHWSAILKIEHSSKEGAPSAPYTVYEFQTTPLGSDEREPPLDLTDNAVRALDYGHRVFGVFDVDTTVEPVKIDFTLCDVKARCRPHREPAPVTTRDDKGVRTKLPYTVHFKAGPRGLEPLEPL